MTVRILLAVFILLLFVLLFVSEKYEKHISINLLNVFFGIECALVVAFIVYDVNLESFGSIVWDIIGYVFLFLLVWIVRDLYLPKTIENGKTYKMSNLKRAIKKGNGDPYAIVSGTIKEGKHTFEVYLEPGSEKIYELMAQGYFDPLASKNKTLDVELFSRKGGWNNGQWFDAQMKMV